MELTVNNMFTRIKLYHEKLGYNYENIPDSIRMTLLRDHVLALHAEVDELLNCFPWKQWRNIADQPTDYKNVAKEVVDCFFFLGSICEIADIFSKELETSFDKVLSENYDRIKSGYNK